MNKHYVLKSLFCLFLCLCETLTAQEVNIEEAGITFTLPNESWELTGNQTVNEVTVYYCKRQPISNSEGVEVIPNMAIIVENVEASTDLVNYSALKRTEVPFEVTDVFSSGDELLNIGDAIGYLGTYEDEQGRSHTVYVIHIVHSSKGLQVIMDITSDLFSSYGNEFSEALKSIKTL